MAVTSSHLIASQTINGIWLILIGVLLYINHEDEGDWGLMNVIAAHGIKVCLAMTFASKPSPKPPLSQPAQTPSHP